MVNTINICIFLQCSIAEANSGARIKERVACRNSIKGKKFPDSQAPILFDYCELKIAIAWSILDILRSSFL